MMTESDLYCIGMESETAYLLMPELCARLGYPFPPRLEKPEPSSIPDPFQKGEPAPVTLAIN